MAYVPNWQMMQNQSQNQPSLGMSLGDAISQNMRGASQGGAGWVANPQRNWQNPFSPNFVQDTSQPSGPAPSGPSYFMQQRASQPQTLPAWESPYAGTSANRLDFTKQPYYPTFRSTVDLETGRVLPQYSFEKSWLPKMNESIASQQRYQTNAAQRLGQRAEGQALSNLAMRGGLSGGNRERVAYRSARDTTGSIQDILAKMGMARTEAAGGAAKSDIENAMSALGNLNQYNLGLFSELMKGYAAKETSKAMAQPSGGGGLFSNIFSSIGL